MVSYRLISCTFVLVTPSSWRHHVITVNRKISLPHLFYLPKWNAFRHKLFRATIISPNTALCFWPRKFANTYTRTAIAFVLMSALYKTKHTRTRAVRMASDPFEVKRLPRRNWEASGDWLALTDAQQWLAATRAQFPVLRSRCQFWRDSGHWLLLT